jgi:phenylpyruvate tautomerase PptA (4-oxalocrotonate tautomerase family)
MILDVPPKVGTRISSEYSLPKYIIFKIIMPLTKISVPRHLPNTQVTALANAIQDGLIKTCNVPPNDLFQLISRFDSDEMILDPHFGGVSRSKDACVIEIIFLVGRTDDQKRALFHHITEQCAYAGFRKDDVMIALVENSYMDWSLGLGVAYADLHPKN